MYLVMLRCAMDDVPLLLTPSENSAIAYAKEAPFEVPEKIGNKWYVDNPSTVVCIHVIRFEAGKPVEIVFTRSADEE